MKRITECMSLGRNPGNGVALGVTNHYTPIDNIVMNVRNLFGTFLGFVATKGDDGVSLTLASSSFTNPQKTQELVYSYYVNFGGGCTYLVDYIRNQGLQGFKVIDLGNSCIVCFFPTDIKNAGKDAVMNAVPVKAIQDANMHECEMIGGLCDRRLINEDSEVELEDRTHEELAEIINNTNKVKAAADFAARLEHAVKLPENMYIKATKDAEGHESISLRYKTVKRRPFGGKMDSVTSLMNIYCTGANAIWVDAYLNKSMYDDTIIDTIEAILQYLGAEATSDEAIWNLPEDGGKMQKTDGNVPSQTKEENTPDTEENTDDAAEGDSNTDNENA